MPDISPQGIKGHQVDETKIVYFSFPDLLPPGHRLALNLEVRSVALLAQLYCGQATEASVARCRQRLQEALSLGTWQGELRPVRRALSSLRNKLRHFDLDISTIRERGCCLTSRSFSEPGPVAF